MTQQEFKYLTEADVEALKTRANSFYVTATIHPELFQAESRQYFSRCDEEINPPSVIERGGVMVNLGIFMDYQKILMDRFEFPLRDGTTILEYGMEIRRVLDPYLVGLFNAFGWQQSDLTEDGVALARERTLTQGEKLRAEVLEIVQSVVRPGQENTMEVRDSLVERLSVFIEQRSANAVKNSEQDDG